jgi:hypothetical protein
MSLRKRLAGDFGRLGEVEVGEVGREYDFCRAAFDDVASDPSAAHIAGFDAPTAATSERIDDEFFLFRQLGD